MLRLVNKRSKLVLNILTMKIIFMFRINLSKKQLILIISFLIIYIVGTILIFTVPFSVKNTYGLSTVTEDGVTISFNIFEPQGGATTKPAFLIGHGSMVNKEMVKGAFIRRTKDIHV